MTTAKTVLQLLIAAVSLNFSGCEFQSAKQARLAAIDAKNQAFQQQILKNKQMATEIEQKIVDLRKIIAERESKWRASVKARHSDWSSDRSEQQIEILLDKWTNSNRTKDEDTVREMTGFGGRWYSLGGIPVELVDDDYWDITRAKSANWTTADQIKELEGQFDGLKAMSELPVNAVQPNAL